jgi:hypothetical protein
MRERQPLVDVLCCFTAALLLLYCCFTAAKALDTHTHTPFERKPLEDVGEDKLLVYEALSY